MAAMTSPLRMPGYFFNDLSSIVSAIAPFNHCHYAITGYTPFSSDVVDNVLLTCSVLVIILGKDCPENERL